MNQKTSQKIKKGVITTTLLLSVGTLGIIGGKTYSKYFTQVNGTGNAVIANWSFKANNQVQTMQNIQLNNSNSETNIKANTIAPGTSGQFDIVIDTTGADVAIDYAIKFSNTLNKPTNLNFEYDGHKSNTLQGLENYLVGTISLKDSRTKTITIKWNWNYETGTTPTEIKTNDVTDNNDTGKQFTFDVTVTGTQVNPGENR